MMADEGISYDEKIAAVEAELLLIQWIVESIEPQVAILSKNRRHDNLFTATYHSVLQPIELLRALIKGNICRSYSAGTSLQGVQKRLENEFSNL